MSKGGRRGRGSETRGRGERRVPGPEKERRNVVKDKALVGRKGTKTGVGMGWGWIVRGMSHGKL